MLISFILPVFNAEKYINKCINSILAQNNDLIEIILVNDGSTDGSANICNYFADNYNNIKVYHQNNMGVSSARNMGIKLAKGKWICFVDTDDWLTKNSLKLFDNTLNSENFEIIIARSYLVDNHSLKQEKYPFSSNLVGDTYSGKDILLKHHYYRGSVWGVFYRKNFLINNNIQFPKNISNGEDSIFILICFLYAKFIKFENIDFYRVFQRQGSASRNWDFNRVLSMNNNLIYVNNYIESSKNLNDYNLHVLHFAIYNIISSIYKGLSKCFTINRFLYVTRCINSEVKYKLDCGKLTHSQSKLWLLNKSKYLFGILIILKNLLSTKLKLKG